MPLAGWFYMIQGDVEQAVGMAADPSLMPAFPGLADTENCRDWEPGIPIEVDRIRDIDEEYWDEHRGTPKAFVELGTGQGLSLGIFLMRESSAYLSFVLRTCNHGGGECKSG